MCYVGFRFGQDFQKTQNFIDFILKYLPSVKKWGWVPVQNIIISMKYIDSQSRLYMRGFHLIYAVLQYIYIYVYNQTEKNIASEKKDQHLST